MSREREKFYMQRALELAEKGRGQVSPNPLVGAVIVEAGNILAEGYHQRFGEAHAEVEALNQLKGEDLSRATLFCNLEPCCHKNKKTPPCTDKIIESGIGHVVIANLDPNPEVSGKGLKQLEDAGIRTYQGLCREQGEELNRVFFTYMREQRPFIHLKVAQTLDGKICSSDGMSKWVSSEASRREVHRLRFEYDAIAIGSQTANLDDPSLTIRMGVKSDGKVPYRLIFAKPDNLKSHLTLLTDEHVEKTKIICGEKVNAQFIGVETWPMPENAAGKMDLKKTLSLLAEKQISSLLVEGGSELMSSFLKEDLYDRLTIYISPKIVGNGKSFFTDESLTMERAKELPLRKSRRLGEDVVLEIDKKENSCLPD